MKGEIQRENGNYFSLEDLFSALSQKYPSFRYYKLTDQRYIGLLKYQLVLSRDQIARLKEALYKNVFEFDDEMTYYEKVEKIIDYVDDDLKSLLRESINSKPHQRRIEDILSNFDPDEYKREHEGLENTTRKQVGKFVYALYLKDEPKLVLLTDVRDQIKKDEYFIQAEDLDYLGSYNPNHVKCNGSDKVELRKIHLGGDTVDIKRRSLNLPWR